MATSTPWGLSDSSNKYAPGIIAYGTPTHGGFHVSAGKLKKMHPALAAIAYPKEGWFEEDSAWCAVVLSFPEFFLAENLILAKKTLKDWYPAAYETFYGEVIPAGESYVKDKAAFVEATKNEFVVFSASGDWHENVPTGMTGVWAKKAATGETKQFLVPANEYSFMFEVRAAKNGHYGFVIDPAKHVEVNWSK